jgi:hypothetical protein
VPDAERLAEEGAWAQHTKLIKLCVGQDGRGFK